MFLTKTYNIDCTCLHIILYSVGDNHVSTVHSITARIPCPNCQPLTFILQLPNSSVRCNCASHQPELGLLTIPHKHSFCVLELGKWVWESSIQTVRSKNTFCLLENICSHCNQLKRNCMASDCGLFETFDTTLQIGDSSYTITENSKVKFVSNNLISGSQTSPNTVELFSVDQFQAETSLNQFEFANNLESLQNSSQQPNLQYQFNFKTKGLHVANLNIRHLKPKMDELRIMLDLSNCVDIFGVCETFF